MKNIRSPLSDCLFFELVLQTLRASQSYDVRQMARPVLGFVQRLEAEYLVGLVPLVSYVYYTGCGTHCQAEASVVSAMVVDCPTSPQDVSHMCDELFATLQTEAQLQQQQCEIALLNQQLETLTLIASAHYWAYDTLLGDTKLPCGHVISRSRLCELIHDNWQTLDESTAAMQRLQRQLESQLKQLQGQRSNWNRNHIDSLLRNEQLQRKLTSDQLEVVHDLSKCASALCTMEQAGCIAGDQNMLHNLEQWLHAHSQWQASNARISGVEQAIVQLLDPEGAIDHCWLANVQGLLEDYTCKVQRDIATLECEQQSRHRNICSLLKEMQVSELPFRKLCLEITRFCLAASARTHASHLHAQSGPGAIGSLPEQAYSAGCAVAVRACARLAANVAQFLPASAGSAQGAERRAASIATGYTEQLAAAGATHPKDDQPRCR